MQLDKEKIIKALECCTCLGENENCPNCKYNTEYLKGSSLLIDALAHIKELTEELVKCYTDKAKLTEENAYLKHIELEAMRGAANSYKIHNEKLTEENERLRYNNLVFAQGVEKVAANYYNLGCTDTVRKMQSEIKERCIKGGIFPAFVASTIDEIAKEMLEENNGQD